MANSNGIEAYNNSSRLLTRRIVAAPIISSDIPAVKLAVAEKHIIARKFQRKLFCNTMFPSEVFVYARPHQPKRKSE